MRRVVVDKMDRMRQTAFAVVAVLVLVASCAAQAPDPTPAPTPAYVERGHSTEARQKAFRERMERFYQALSRALRRNAPDLLRDIAPPPPGVHGYQILPKITKDIPAPSPGEQAQIVRFSWSLTDTRIEQELGALQGLEMDLLSLGKQTRSVARNGRRDACAKLATGYRQLAARVKSIDGNIEYNWLWQKQIAEQRPTFDYLQKVQDQLQERYALDNALASQSDAELRTVAGRLKIDVSESAAAPLDATPEVKQDVQSIRLALSARRLADNQAVTAFQDRGAPPDIAAIEHPSPENWIIRVKLYTDIEDAAFVRSVKEGIESWWHVRTAGENAGEDFHLELDVQTLSPRRLYCEPPDGADRVDRANRGTPANRACAPPSPGLPIDLNAHVARFPEDGAVLTTGATTLQVVGTRALVFGPGDTAPRVLAHEFGHILGLPDTYVRGYRDLGPDGFEITELADLTDIMGAPGAGPVLPRHFERLITARARALLDQSFRLCNQQHYSESIDAARRALALKADYAEAYNNIGFAYAGLGLWEPAIAAVEEALRLQPNFQLAKNNLAWFLERKRSETHPPS
jgi:tetratricopeptide (TPR) repeat protein